VHANLRLTDDLYGGPIPRLTENDLVYSVAETVFRLRSRQRHDVPDGGRRHHRC